MTVFNPDPRVRDSEPNTTALGPNFPGSINDLWRMVFRPSHAFLRYVTIAISNDDGSAIMGKVESHLQEILDEEKKQTDLLQQILEKQGGI